MATPLPTELVREFRVLPPSHGQLLAIGSTAPATSAFLEALDWMLAIIWPFAYEDPFQLSASPAPAQIGRRIATLRELSSTYPRVDVVPMPEPPGRRVANGANSLELGTGRLLAFESRAIELAAPESVALTEPRDDRLRRFWRTVSRADLDASEVTAAARLLRVTVDRIRDNFWRVVRVDMPADEEEWGELLR